MESYLIPIKWAIIIFPLLAALITLPYIIYQYRKYGAIPTIRTIILYSFVLYLLTAYFLIILPLPPISEVAHYTTPKVQIIPFYFVADIFKNIPTITSISSFFKFLGDASIYNVLFNILLFIPFGIYLRYYFQYSFKKALWCSFLLSLFFELTQLSGLYGIYPRPYRLFDVDDLMMNTLGGCIGFMITPFLTKILPSKEKIDQKAFEKGTQVSFLRRLIAFMIDFIITFFITGQFHISYIYVVVVYFALIPFLTKGKTLGKTIMRIRITNINGENATIDQYLIRMFILYLILIPTPVTIFSLATSSISSIWFPIKTGIIIILLIAYFAFFIQIIRTMFSPTYRMWHEKYSKTINSSTIPIPQEKTKK